MDIVIDANPAWLAGFRAEHGDRHLLAMSRGKDALAAWCVLLEAGVEVYPVHFSVVPGLAFVAESLAAISAKFGVTVLDLPHRSLFRMLNACVFQPPERVAVIDAWDPKVPEYTELYAHARAHFGLPSSALTASGVRACDSIVRRIAFQKHGAVRQKTQTFYPVWNFNKAQTMMVLKRHGVELPIDYKWFGRSFDGVDHRFLAPLAKYAPADYQRVLEWFPLAELELFRAKMGAAS